MRSEQRVARPVATVPGRASGTPDRDAAAEEPLARLVWVLLRGGVILSTVIVAAGGIAFLLGHAGTAPRFSDFRGRPVALSAIPRMLRTLGHDDGYVLMLTGTIVLIATPVARVIVSFLDFLRERNWIYVGLTALVLGALAISIIEAY